MITKPIASTYTITVQAKDELNATTEGNFTVTLLDVYEPSRENHTVDLNSTVDLEMIWVEPGTFTMGSDSSESGHDANEAPQHQVTLTKGFYLGKYEVTQQQYLAVTNSNPSHFADDPNLPVEMLSQVEAIAFANQVTNIARSNGTLPGGWMYDLPTESEWEYACRAGTTTSRYWGDSVDQHMQIILETE